MLICLALFMAGALLAPPLMRKGRLGFVVLSTIPAAIFCYLLSLAPSIFRGKISSEFWPWAPQLGMNLSFRIDQLSWLMALIVTGVGALVLFYCSRYFSVTARGVPRFAAVFTAFAAAMLGLVTTNNTLSLYLFWELTTVFSFLLIGHNYHTSVSRRAAMQAIILTTAGGLAMLVGIIILGELPGGSYEITELLASIQSNRLGVDQLTGHTATALLNTAIVLLMAGAFTKSAIIPFHFWLPAAMAAPTPVSTYLHAAAMVKAGVYLVARFAPGFAGYPIWQIGIPLFGICTLLLGGYRALRQYDLKLVLAFGTVSQLGLLMILVGYGTSAMLLAGLMMLLAHALFKSALFLSIGIIDWAVGTRDLRQLTGLRKKMPVTALFSALAGASMMGLPPFAGFVAKEAALHTLIGSDFRATITWIAIAIGSAFTVAYTLRYLWGAFADKENVVELAVKKRSWMLLGPVIVLSLSGLLVGIIGGPSLERLLLPYVENLPGESGHLLLWSGFSWALLVTLLVLLSGCAIFALRRPWERITEKLEFPLRASGIYQKAIDGLENLSGYVTGFTQRGSLPAYLSTILFFTLLVGGAALLGGNLQIRPAIRLFDSPAQLAVAVIAALAAIFGARARHRIKAVLLIGVSGYAVAFIYELYGAPDLALTQTLAETMSLVVFILVLRRLPIYFSNRPLRLVRQMRILLACAVGISAALITWLAAGARTAAPISEQFPAEAYYYGYGSNIVNVTLVDIRAWDTLGEISVVVAAAVGISSLLFIRDRKARIDRFRNLLQPGNTVRVWEHPQDKTGEAPAWHLRRARQIESTVRASGRNRLWLAGSTSLSSPRRSVILEVGTRLVFHTIILLSLYFLLAGHNNPGGGFAAGIMAGTALVLRYVAGGRYELGTAMPLHPGHLLGGGLALAAIAALAPTFFGGTILQSAKFHFSLPLFGPVNLATAIFFDIGVFFIVVGLVLDILRSLGAEIDRHGEKEGISDEVEMTLLPRADMRRAAAEAAEAAARYAADEEEAHA